MFNGQDKRQLGEKEQMVDIKNCWEFMNCGREPGGLKVDKLGICPAATNTCFHGMNRGKAGGRACWNIEGTLCKETSGEKQLSCANCPFFMKVKQQEGRYFVLEPHSARRRTGLPGQEFVVLDAKLGPAGHKDSLLS